MSKPNHEQGQPQNRSYRWPANLRGSVMLPAQPQYTPGLYDYRQQQQGLQLPQDHMNNMGWRASPGVRGYSTGSGFVDQPAGFGSLPPERHRDPSPSPGPSSRMSELDVDLGTLPDYPTLSQLQFELQALRQQVNMHEGRLSRTEQDTMEIYRMVARGSLTQSQAPHVPRVEPQGYPSPLHSPFTQFNSNNLSPIIPMTLPGLSTPSASFSEEHRKAAFQRVFPHGSTTTDDDFKFDSKEFEHIQFWDRQAWSDFCSAERKVKREGAENKTNDETNNKPPSKEKTSIRRKRNDPIPAKKQQYIQMVDGSLIDGRRLDELRQILIKIFAQLLEYSIDGISVFFAGKESWKDVEQLDEELAKCIYREVYHWIIEFAYGSKHWKVREFLVDWYHSWFKSNIGAVDDDEVVFVEGPSNKKQKPNPPEHEPKPKLKPKLVNPLPVTASILAPITTSTPIASSSRPMPRPANASQNGEPDPTAITSIPGNSVAEMDIDPILQGQVRPEARSPPQDESTLVLTPPATMASSKGPSGLESVEKSTPSGASIGATTAASVTKEVATPTSATMATMLSKDQFADGNDSAERTRQNSLATDFAEFPPPPLPVRVPAPAATPAAESTTIPSTSKAKTKGAAVPKPKKVLVGEYKPICEQVWCTDNQKNKTAFRQHWSTLTEQERQDWGLGLLAKRKADAEQNATD